MLLRLQQDNDRRRCSRHGISTRHHYRGRFMTAVLFVVLVISWGFSWYAIKLQLGIVPPEVSVGYRFALAALILWVGLAITGKLQKANWNDHRRFALMGLFLFGLNFMAMYEATHYVTSGVVAVLFSTASVFNVANQWIFFAQRPRPRVLVGALLGIGGIALVFGREMIHLGATQGAALGVLLALGGTLSFSIGNIVSARLKSGRVDIPNAVARGMTWSTCYFAIYTLARGDSFTFDPSPVYVLSLLYLAVIGSVLAFLAYLSLIGRVGADRAAYTTVFFPLVALGVSTVFEGYEWTWVALVGLALILLGNVVIFAPAGAFKSLPWRRGAADSRP
jgi:drug/metabolite transporter (DMT)-like permease